MKFFVPHTKSTEDALSVIDGIAKFIGNSTPQPEEMIYSLTYNHNGQTMVATVGEPVDEYYREAVPEVQAIFPPSSAGQPYKICLPNRGVLRGEPIYTSNEIRLQSFECN